MARLPEEDERIVAEDPDFPPPGAERGPADLSGFLLHMVGHAHIDLGYRWNQAETVHYVAPWTFRGVLDLMDRTPGFTFCQSQMYLYEAMRREYPEIMARIRRAIDQGRWEVVGGAWCEYDAILPSGEAVIRQHLTGVRYAREHLGVTEQRVAFVPDSFCGHAATLPQILAGCGFSYYVFGRGLPQDPGAPERTRRAFRWVGPDGSGVVAYLPFGPYATPPMTPAYLENLLPYARTSVTEEELVLYGQGDHGGGPRDAEIQALQALAGRPRAPRWKYSTVHALCAAAFDEETVRGLEEHRGNLGGFAAGALTSQARIKRANRRMEKELVAAEGTAVIGTLLSRKPAFPRQEVKQLWRRLLTEQFHDILPGTSVAAVYRDTEAAYRQVEEGAGHLLRDGFARICSRLDTRGEGLALVAFNPRLVPVSGPFHVELPGAMAPAGGEDPLGAPAQDGAAELPEGGDAGMLHGARARLVDAEGVEVPWHREGSRLVFAGRLPPLGYAMYRWIEGSRGEASPRPGESAPGRAGAVPESPPALGRADGRMETPRYRLRMDMERGDLVELEHRSTGRALLSGPSNTLRLYGEPAMATAWVHALDGTPQELSMVHPPRVVEAHPLFTRIATTSRSAFSTFHREVTLYADQDRIDFRIVLDWHEGNAFLKLGFLPALQNPEVWAALAHGTVRVSDPEHEFCCHDFVDLRTDREGLAVLNDGSYGCSVTAGRVELSVIRTARDMDPHMAHGTHELRYSLYPHEGSTSVTELLSQGAAMEQPVLCAWEPAHPGGIRRWGRFDNTQPLPAAQGFVSVDSPHVVLCAFKLLEEEWSPLSFVVRVRETDGTATDCWVDLPVPVARAVAADHLERPLDEDLQIRGRSVRVPLGAFQIRTFVATV